MEGSKKKKALIFSVAAVIVLAVVFMIYSSISLTGRWTARDWHEEYIFRGNRFIFLRSDRVVHRGTFFVDTESRIIRFWDENGRSLYSEDFVRTGRNTFLYDNIVKFERACIIPFPFP